MNIVNSEDIYSQEDYIGSVSRSSETVLTGIENNSFLRLKKFILQTREC